MDKEIRSLLVSSRYYFMTTGLTGKEISRKLYISETYLRKLYKIYFRMSPKKYIKNVKIKKGQTLLRISDKTVTQISHDLGYVNSSKFAEDFKIKYQMNPTEFRKSCYIVNL